MGIQFNADEVFEMAEEIEKNGAKFYRKAAQGTINSRTRDLLLDLANREDAHQETFASMRATLPDKEKGWEIYDPEGQTAMYLKAMAQGQVFDAQADPSGRLTGEETEEEILQMAIGLEKDSVVFYLRIQWIVPEKLGKDKILDIIKEESDHLLKLETELAALKE
jgi:rubrerythrin